MKFVLASHNKGKLAEMQAVLADLGIEVVMPADLGIYVDVEETGTTFAENAMLKAKAICAAADLPAIADDSGLCVDALNGGPGVYSARYYGEDTPYTEKNRYILSQLEGLPQEKRTARFVAHITCVLSPEQILDCEGVCEGTIGLAPAGEGGFGYDPIFYVGDKSFAQLDGEAKDAVSHRGKALAKLYEQLKKLQEN